MLDDNKGSDLEKLKIFVGCTGFNYDSWQYKIGGFYPPSIKREEQLDYYSTQFPCCEINSTFYTIPTIETTRRWSMSLPKDFVLTAKIPKMISHSEDISSHYELLNNFLNSLLPLKRFLGPIILQLPPSYERNKQTQEQLEMFFKQFPLEQFKLAVEFRHRTWLESETIDLLNENKVGIVSSFLPYMPFELHPQSKVEYFYIRLIGSQKTPVNTGKEVINRTGHMKTIVSLLEKALTQAPHKKLAFIFVNNHYSGYAPKTAVELKKLIKTSDQFQIMLPKKRYKGQLSLSEFFREEK